MQSLYISNGCDYISYFKTFGKATIINNFMQYANFISNSNACTILILLIKILDFYHLYVLWGPAILKKHIAANYGHTTPLQLYNSVNNALPVLERHEIWLKKIRQAVCNRIINEEDRVPTYTSLWHHWLRSSWTHQMWQRSVHRDVPCHNQNRVDG